MYRPFGPAPNSGNLTPHLQCGAGTRAGRFANRATGRTRTLPRGDNRGLHAGRLRGASGGRDARQARSGEGRAPGSVCRCSALLERSRRSRRRPEYAAREAADEQWLRETFDEAQDSVGVMIIWQADPGFDTSGYQGAPKRDPATLVETDGNPDGFHDILSRCCETRRSRSRSRSCSSTATRTTSWSISRSSTPTGAASRTSRASRPSATTSFSAHPRWDTNDVHWVKALVDRQSRDVFAFQAQVVPANRVSVPSP
jgi:hypothetical protein